MAETAATEMQLAHEAEKILRLLRGRLISNEELEILTREKGVELATMTFHRSVLGNALHGGFFTKVNAQTVPSYQADLWSPVPRDIPRRPFEVLVVQSVSPHAGMKWGERSDDVRRIARGLGFTTDTLDTLEANSLSDNARLISRDLQTRNAENIILVTFGRGAAEFRMLLQRRAQNSGEFSKVRAWINIAGTFSGSEYHDQILQQPLLKWNEQFLSRFRGRSYEAFLEEAKSFGLWRERFQLPNQLLTISMVGVPLASHIPHGLRGGYALLSKMGPNDGYTLLRDCVAQPGLIYPVWGMSHRAEMERLKPVFPRLLLTLAESFDLKVREPKELELPADFTP